MQVASVPIIQSETPLEPAPTEEEFNTVGRGPQTKTVSVKSISEFKTKTFTFSAIIAGDYPVLKAFLDGLINMRRIVAIDSIGFIPARDEALPEGAVGRPMRLVLKLHSYYLSK